LFGCSKGRVPLGLNPARRLSKHDAGDGGIQDFAGEDQLAGAAVAAAEERGGLAEDHDIFHFSGIHGFGENEGAEFVFGHFAHLKAAAPGFGKVEARERIDLSLEDEAVDQLHPRLAGMDDLLASIEDLVDRARFPSAYQELKIGNEVLIIGPSQSGKKSLAQTLAKATGMERLVTVYNPRDSDALAKAKSLVRGYKRKKVMLLLPRIDLAYKESDPEVLTELDALIESTSERQNVLVVATAVTFEPDSDLDNLFGIKLALPGAEVTGVNRRANPDEVQPEVGQMMAKVAPLAHARDEFNEAGQRCD
jgi:hypothetical protein